MFEGIMNLKKLASGLEFRGKVKGQRQTYYVFEGEKFFFVCSFSRTRQRAGYFNIVDVEAVRYVERLAGGEQGVTAPDLYRRSRTPRYISSSLEALNVLYILVATGRASIDRRHRGRKLFFNLSSR